jgi:hypothetical protein
MTKEMRLKIFWIVFSVALLAGAQTASAQDAASKQQQLKHALSAYGQAWSADDAAQRAKLLAGIWDDSASYTDPTADVKGTAGLLSVIEAFHKQFPGARLVPVSSADLHHGQFRFAWKAVGADGSTVVDGMDFGELGPDGKLRKIVGFFGPLPTRM